MEISKSNSFMSTGFVVLITIVLQLHPSLKFASLFAIFIDDVSIFPFFTRVTFLPFLKSSLFLGWVSQSWLESSGRLSILTLTE